jgi:hypothetical protein
MVCPGSCHLEESEKRPDTNKFTGADSLRHHLNNAACVKVVLEDLDVEDLLESVVYLAPFCNGPERRWEDHDCFKSVKEAKMKLRNFSVRRNPTLVFRRVCRMAPHRPHPLISSFPPTLTLDFLGSRNFQLWLTSKIYHRLTPHRFRPSGAIDLPRSAIVNLA